MTRIAFCDDDAALLHQMQDFLEQYRTLRRVQLELAPYTKPMELLADIEAGVQFTVQAGISQALPVSESDLCVLLSNALENALHAAVRCREAGQGAFIETTGHEKGKSCFCRSPTAVCRTCSSGRASRSPTAPATGLGCAASAPSQSGTAA